MKKLLTTFVALLFCLVTYAQSVPQGMKYQAVARDQQGQVLANHDINLLIELLLDGKSKEVNYSEIHRIRTNELGLFDITIGEGQVSKGDFVEVPWSENEIWMQISLDEKNTGNFTTISNTKLLAVPYAMHAGSAEKLSEESEEDRNGGIYWHILGNSGTFPGITFIGTTDFKDFVMKTNNTEVMRLTALGKVEFQGDISVGNNALIGNDLSVDNDASIGNDLDVDGIARFNNTTESTNKDNGAVIVEGGVGIEKNTNIGGNGDINGTLNVGQVTTLESTTESTSKDNGALVVEGGVGIEKNANIGGNGDINGTLNVGQVTTLESTTQSTSKDNGALVVEGGAGIEKNINVGGNGDINGTLNVGQVTTLESTTQSTSKDNGALVVEGGAGIEKNINVGGNSDINGTLNVGQVTTLESTTQSTSKDNGALVVEGGVGIEKNINVGGNGDINGTLNVAQVTTLESTTQSTSKDNGALVVEGGAGIEKNINVGGNGDINGTLNVGQVTTLESTTQSTSKDNGALVVEGGVGIEKNINVGGNGDINGTLNVGQVTTLESTTQSTSKDNGALVVEGGVGIEKNINVGGTSKLNGQVTIDADITGGGQEDYAQYPLQVQGGDHGVAIQINNVTPDRNANFLTMFDGNGDPMGRIEGFQALTGVARATIEAITDDIEDDPDSVDESETPTSADAPSSAAQFFNSDYGFGLLNETFDLVYAAIVFATNVIGCAAGVGILGDCDDAVWSGIGVGVQVIKLAGFLIYNEINRGVAFESGGADYAEWLEKEDASEMLSFGDVVGVKGGFVSKDFLEAEQFMVISQNPTVIGAMPQTGEEFRYEKIAFMGQAPVKVVGIANRGDYILPSGKGDGYAIAIAPEEMKTKDYGRIIGISWGESDGKKMFDYVNTAVGINSNDMVNTVEQMQFVMNEMQRALQQLNPDYQPHIYDVNNQVMANAAQISTADYNSFEQIAAQQMGITPNTSYQDAMTAIQAYSSAHGMDLNDFPYIVDVMNNPEDKELAQQMLNHYTSVLAKLEKIMAEIDRG